MDGDLLALTGVVVASVIGSTGVSGLLAGGTEFGRRNRFRRRAERAIDLLGRVKPRTPEWEALTYSARLDGVRLAALSSVGLIRRVRENLWRLVLVYALQIAVAAGLITYVLFGPVARTNDVILVVASVYGAVSLASSVAVVMLLSWRVRHDRDRFVTRVMAGESPAIVAADLDKLPDD